MKKTLKIFITIFLIFSGFIIFSVISTLIILAIVAIASPNYVNSYDTGSDLIYRASENDSIEVIADYFNTDINTLNNFNKINSEKIVDSQPIINPDISSMEVFSQNIIFGIDNNKTKFY